MVSEPLILSGEIAAGRTTIDGNAVAGLTIAAGAAQQTQIFDVNLVDLVVLDVIGSDALLQDSDVTARADGVRLGPGSSGPIGGAAGNGNRIFGHSGNGVELAGSSGAQVAGAPDRDRRPERRRRDPSPTRGPGVRHRQLAQRGRRVAHAVVRRGAVTGNRIGTLADGTGSAPNGTGVLIAGSGCQLGGGATPNAIAGNAGHGVLVSGPAAVLRGNLVRANGADGIATTGAGTARLRATSSTATAASVSTRAMTA